MRKKTIEDYVEVLYNLEKNKKIVHTNDVATSLNINPASVTEIFGKLNKEGYLIYKKYSGATLSKKGRELAVKTKNRHNNITQFLILLGVEKKIAEQDACEMEHFLHKSTMETIIKFVELMKECKITPIWLERLKLYVKTGKLAKCPDELHKLCLKYSKK